MTGDALVVDAARWTGRRDPAAIAVDALARRGIHEIDRAAVPHLYAISDGMAARAGIPPPRMFFSPRFGGFGAAAYPRFNFVVLTSKGLSRAPAVIRGLIAHEIGHLAARHASKPTWFFVLRRPMAGVSLVLALALGSAPLTLAATAALVLAEMAVRGHVGRCEAEADTIAAGLIGSVVPLLTLTPEPLTWRRRLWLCVLGYPQDAPWLGRLASRELVDLHNCLAARPRRP